MYIPTGKSRILYELTLWKIKYSSCHGNEVYIYIHACILQLIILSGLPRKVPALLHYTVSVCKKTFCAVSKSIGCETTHTLVYLVNVVMVVSVHCAIGFFCSIKYKVLWNII